MSTSPKEVQIAATQVPQTKKQLPKYLFSLMNWWRRRESNPRPLLPHHLTPPAKSPANVLRNRQRFQSLPWLERSDDRRFPKPRARFENPFGFSNFGRLRIPKCFSLVRVGWNPPTHPPDLAPTKDSLYFSRRLGFVLAVAAESGSRVYVNPSTPQISRGFSTPFT